MSAATPVTSPEVLASGYARCAQITREHGTTYYWGARLLPAESRRHVHAVYTLARLADDIVDLAGPNPGPETALALDAFEQSFWVALATGTAPDPVMAAIATSVREVGIDDECFTRFFGAMRSDLTRRTYETWGDLLGYMDGSAAVIGEMMLPVLRPGTDAVAPARALGLAFQLTNFLRDVGEDLDRGRVYLPQEDLRRFGADPHARVVTPEWRALMAFEIERNRRLYREADDGLPALPGASRRCVATARVLYARILERIEAADYDVFDSRARVPTPRKAALAARMVVSREPMRLVHADRAARDPHHGAWVSDDDVVLLDDAGSPVGRAPKSVVHHDDTPLHLAFSCYVVDPAGRLLVTTRAASKPSFPGVVTNTVCGHPRPGEDLAEAVRRRARSELGVEVGDLRLVLPDFRYRAVMNGLVEHELCPVFVGFVDDDRMATDPAEVDDAQWVPWARFRDEVLAGDRTVSPWCTEQVPLLDALGPDPHAWPAGPRAELPPGRRARAPTPRRREAGRGRPLPVPPAHGGLPGHHAAARVRAPRPGLPPAPAPAALAAADARRLPGRGTSSASCAGTGGTAEQYTTGIRPVRVPLEESSSSSSSRSAGCSPTRRSARCSAGCASGGVVMPEYTVLAVLSVLGDRSGRGPLAAHRHLPPRPVLDRDGHRLRLPRARRRLADQAVGADRHLRRRGRSPGSACRGTSRWRTTCSGSA